MSSSRSTFSFFQLSSVSGSPLFLAGFAQSLACLNVRVVHIRPRENETILGHCLSAFVVSVQRLRCVQVGHRCQSLVGSLCFCRGEKFRHRQIIPARLQQGFAVFEMTTMPVRSNNPTIALKPFSSILIVLLSNLIYFFVNTMRPPNFRPRCLKSRRSSH